MNKSDKFHFNSYLFYYRFNPNLDGTIQLDETDDIKLIEMMFKTKVYMHLNKSKVTEMVKCLQLKF